MSQSRPGPPQRRPAVNPKLMAGRKGFTRIERIERRERPQFLVLLLLILGIALVIFRLTAGRSTTEEAPATVAAGDPQWERVAPARLDPETFRAQIQRLEGFLYDPNADDLTQIGANIDRAASALIGALRERDGDTAAEAARALRALPDGVEPTRFGLSELATARRSWTQLRGRYFQDAPWLATGTPARDDADRATLLVLHDFAGRLARVAEEGEREVAALQQEAEVAINDAGAAEIYDRWVPWAQNWQSRIAALQAEKPTFYAPQAAPELLLAVQNLDRALGTLDALANDRSLPQQADAVNRIAAATTQASDARRTFDAQLF